jgi:hypothetical protein
LRYPLVLLGLTAAALAGCERDPFVVKRTTCPAVAIPQYAGEVTRFSPADSRDQSALDFTAAITGVRSTCDERGATVDTVATYDVVAMRRAPGPAREETLPVFAAVTRGGQSLVSKEVGQVVVRFADGQTRGVGRGQARSAINRAEVALPGDIVKKITRERKPGDPDAAIDPLARPDVRDQVRRATFELLIGFQLSAPELAYNARK